jgi:hypothetical protein
MIGGNDGSYGLGLNKRRKGRSVDEWKKAASDTCLECAHTEFPPAVTLLLLVGVAYFTSHRYKLYLCVVTGFAANMGKGKSARRGGRASVTSPRNGPTNTNVARISPGGSSELAGPQQ